MYSEINAIFIGYILTICYGVFLLIFLAPLLERRLSKETGRKIIHTSLFLIWIIINSFLKNSIHQIIVPFLFIIINAISYRYKIFQSIERDQENYPGTIYFAISVTGIMFISYFFSEIFICTGYAVACLTFGDGIAGIIGYLFGRKTIIRKKTFAGSFGCFIGSIVGMYIVNCLYNGYLPLYWILLLGIISTIAELIDFGLDNITITGSIFWAGSLYVYASNKSKVFDSLLIALVIFAIVFLLKAIDYYGSIAAFFIVYIFAYCGEKRGLFFLLGTYFSIFIIAVAKKILLRKKHYDFIKKDQKNLLQILINGLLGTIFAVIYGVCQQEWYLIIAFVCIGGCFIDSISSDIGVLSHKKPYDIVHRRFIETGLSGGISLLGTASAMLFDGIIIVYMYFCFKLNINKLILIYSVILFQTFLDTLFGALIQARYQCCSCGVITEKKYHCGVKCQKIKGFSAIDNNMVNWISSVGTMLLACLVI